MEVGVGISPCRSKPKDKSILERRANATRARQRRKRPLTARIFPERNPASALAVSLAGAWRSNSYSAKTKSSKMIARATAKRMTRLLRRPVIICQSP